MALIRRFCGGSGVSRYGLAVVLAASPSGLRSVKYTDTLLGTAPEDDIIN